MLTAVEFTAAEQGRSAAGALDLAVALGSEADEPVEQPSYNQTAEPGIDETLAEEDPPVESLGIERPPASAEEIQPSEEGATRRRYRPITEVTVDATLPAGLLPEQVAREEADVEPGSDLPEIGDPRLMGGWGDQVFQWSATRLCHGPLYFEEVNLERYGYQCHPAVQPFMSGAHFFLTVPTLPYQMTVHPPRECIYTLGHYRPGSRVPWQRHRLPWDARAAAVQAGVTVGLIFLIP